ncbi:MAG: GNAT family N-acetyltransferase [Chitinophagales bacterium]
MTLVNLEELKQISRKTFSDAFASMNSKENMLLYLSTAFSDEKLSAELTEENSQFYFAKYREETVGYLKISFDSVQTDLQDKDAMELERIYIKSTFQGKGIGKKLLSQAISIAQKKKVNYIWLGVWDKNEKAIQFYKKNGFEIFSSYSFQMGNESQTDYLMTLIL